MAKFACTGSKDLLEALRTHLDAVARKKRSASGVPGAMKVPMGANRPRTQANLPRNSDCSKAGAAAALDVSFSHARGDEV